MIQGLSTAGFFRLLVTWNAFNLYLRSEVLKPVARKSTGVWGATGEQTCGPLGSVLPASLVGDYISGKLHLSPEI
jgi:hypothetical protein